MEFYENIAQPVEDEDGSIPLVEDALVGEADGAPEEVESDNEIQDKEEEASLDTTDTVNCTKLGSAGQMYFGPDKSLVCLTTKVQSHTILCVGTSITVVVIPSTKLSS